MLLNEGMINDQQCNDLIDKYYKPQDYIIFYDSALQRHLSNKIAADHFIYSTTLNIIDINQINEITKNNILVLNYMKNNDNEYLKQLQFPHNIELLCAETCIPNCPHKYQHYLSYSKANLGLPLDETDIINCPFADKKIKPLEDILQQSLNLPSSITNTRVNELSDMGFQYFKISGRFASSERFFYIISYYVIKEQYLETARKELNIQLYKKLLQDKIKSQT